jgi:anti-sigma factor (TIGR02949 family)
LISVGGNSETQRESKREYRRGEYDMINSSNPFFGKSDGARQPETPYDPFGAINPMAATDCSAMLKRLYNFLDGELTDDRRNKIQNHLDSCPTCFSAFDFEAELRDIVARKSKSQVPAELAEKIRLSICLPSLGTDPGPMGTNSF